MSELLDTTALYLGVNGTQSIMPIGTIAMWGNATPPTGWLLCDGHSVNHTTYTLLHDVIGTYYPESGGNFSLPNFQGRIPLNNPEPTWLS